MYIKSIKKNGLSALGKTINLEAAQYISKNPVDIVFTDIQMPGLNGIEFTWSMVNGPVVIFTTAFSKYATEGFKLDIADYLLKPFTYEEFLDKIFL